ANYGKGKETRMIIEYVPVYHKRRAMMPPPESYYAFRAKYLSGLGQATCPSPTKLNANGNCCIPPSYFDNIGNRCAAPGAALVPNGNKFHWGGSAPPQQCVPNCTVPSPSGGSMTKQCGDNGCGGSCGTCGAGTECQGGSCVPETGGGGGSTTTTGGGGGGGTSVSIGNGGGGFDFSSLMESPLVWIGGGLLLVAVAYRIIRKPQSTSPSVIVTK
ncbi:hypothetical protein L0244_30445, partial [bacterium]|nr:hypothetical protein [bacterium]